jgi:ribosomal protein S26
MSMDVPRCEEHKRLWVECEGCGKLFPRAKAVELSTGPYMPECVSRS